MNKDRLRYLFDLYLNKNLDVQEQLEWEALIMDPNLDSDFKGLVDERWESFEKQEKVVMPMDRANALFLKITSSHSTKRKMLNIWPKIAAAAILVLVASYIFYLSQPHSKYIDQENNSVVNDIAPGSNSAILTLSNGKKILLTNSTNGELANESGVVISKAADGKLLYKVGSKGTGKEVKLAYNTLATARGETYQVILPDGSLVYLNAASSLTFPSSFYSLKERVVKLNGEAYFEISKNKAVPFIVETQRQRVRVLGTHFNVNAYKDEPVTKTTLLEGSVQINDNTILKPGELALNNNDNVIIKLADIEMEVAWKTGFFIFRGETLESAMRKVSRWYDIDVIYSDGVNKSIPIGGAISRTLNLSVILKGMESVSHVKFILKDRTITVIKMGK